MTAAETLYGMASTRLEICSQMHADKYVQKQHSKILHASR